MTLAELVEPLFSCVCRVNRSARQGQALDVHTVRADLRVILSDIQTNSLTTPGLREQLERVRLGLVGFVDYMMRNMPVIGEQWQNMGEEETPPEYALDEKFFAILDGLLKDRSEQATERIAVMYTAMALGFKGYLESDHVKWQAKLKEAAARVRPLMDGDGPEGAARICPEAYASVDGRNLTLPPIRSIAPMVVILIGLIAILFGVNFYLYRAGRADLVEAMNKTRDALNKQAATQPTTNPAGGVR